MLAETRKLAPQIPINFLFNHKTSFDEAMKISDQLQVEIIGPYGLWHVWPWTIREAHKKGLIVHPYTINSSWRMDWMHWMGADGLFTDHCETALNKSGRLSEEQANEIIEKYLPTMRPDDD